MLPPPPPLQTRVHIFVYLHASTHGLRQFLMVYYNMVRDDAVFSIWYWPRYY